MNTAKICLQCGSEYDGSTLFCPRDGSALKLVDPGSTMIGQVVAERFLVHKELGKGGMGQVFLAEQVRIGRRCALKVIREGLVSDPDAVLRFNREASNAASISHPNVVQVYDFGESKDGLIFLAMEYVDGESLGALLAREGTVAPLRAVSITAQVAKALTAAHDLKIIHRDLKPDNVMLGRDRDGSDLVKVVDFGVARVMDAADQKVTGTGLVIGTPEYMSPEQFTGKPIDGRSDLYSLVLILFRMLTGTPAFDAEGAREALEARFSRQPKRLAAANPNVAWPPGLQEVMDRGMALKVEDRYQTVEAFADALVAVTSYWHPEDDRTAGSVASDSSSMFGDRTPPGASAAVPAPPRAQPGGATAAFSSGAPPNAPSVSPPIVSSPTPARARSERSDGASAAVPGALPSAPAATPPVSSPGVPAPSEPAGRRGPVVWVAALVAVVVVALVATRGMWSGGASEQGGTQAPPAATTSTPSVSPADSVSLRPDSTAGVAGPDSVSPGSDPRVAAGGAGGGSEAAIPARKDSSAGRPSSPPTTEGSGGEETAESGAIRAQLARLKTLTDSSASPAQAREALRMAGGIHPATREGRVELKYRTLEANILLDQTSAVCSLLSQLRFEAKGTRFEEAVAAYGAVAQESCPAR